MVARRSQKPIIWLRKHDGGRLGGAIDAHQAREATRRRAPNACDKFPFGLTHIQMANSGAFQPELAIAGLV
jgi:hypothetical protein